MHYGMPILALRASPIEEARARQLCNLIQSRLIDAMCVIIVSLFSIAAETRSAEVIKLCYCPKIHFVRILVRNLHTKMTILLDLPRRAARAECDVFVW